MTKLIEIYNRLESKNVVVCSFGCGTTVKAMTYETPNNKTYIGINSKLIKSESEELCVLAEEEAHYEVGIIPTNYESNSSLDIISRRKNELKAKKFAVSKLVPKDKLMEKIRNITYINITELAEDFGVTPEFMHEALKIYRYMLI